MPQILVHLILSLPLVGAFAIFALGIVVIFRASGVLNLAHGAMAMVPAYLAYEAVRAGVPIGLAFLLAVLVGGAIGVVTERAVLRRLRGGSPTTRTVGTVAVLGVLVAGAARIWGTAPLRAPSVFPEGQIEVGRSHLLYGDIGLFVTSVLVTVGFFYLLQRTDLGLIMRGAADNPRAAALMGVDPDLTTSIAWFLGGALAGGSGVMLAAVTNLHPYTLSLQVLPAFVAALIGGLGSLPGALAGAGVVGIAFGVVPNLGPLGEQSGAPQLVLTLLALGGMAFRGARAGGGDARGGAGVRAARAARSARAAFGGVADRVRAFAEEHAAAMRWAPRVGIALIIVFPWLPVNDSVRSEASLAATYTIVSIAIVILTGWVGQISLAHAALVGVAAFTTGMLARAGLPFPLNLPIAALAAGGVATILGVVALRVRGLYLAVATMIFGWMADAYLFKQSWFVGEGGSSTIPARALGRAGGFPYIDFTSTRTLYYVTVAAAAATVLVAANLRQSATGRAFSAVRGSEVAAASLGIDVTRTKLLAFAISGTLAGIAGNLIMLDQRTARADQFDLAASLFFLSMAVVGGLFRLRGAAGASILFAALYEVSRRVRVLDGLLPLVSALLLLTVLLVRGGDGVRRHRAPKRPVESAPSSPAEQPPPPARAGSPLQVEHVTVRFGGLVAVDDLSLTVDPAEIVGLIGPNGAGKTTAFNAVSGMVSATEGRVALFGTDATAMTTHARARLGLGRTFQIIQLLGDLTVRENLMVAAHMHIRSGFLAHIAVSARALHDEAAARARVHDALALTDLEAVADESVSELPFGVLRRVEVARAVVTGASLIMLDEPASGLDDRETDALAALLLDLRARTGTALLVIEHDVRFVAAVCDRIYVLDRGALLAHGTPAEIRADAAVQAAYLGGATDPLLA